MLLSSISLHNHLLRLWTLGGFSSLNEALRDVPSASRVCSTQFDLGDNHHFHLQEETAVLLNTESSLVCVNLPQVSLDKAKFSDSNVTSAAEACSQV
ncbi:hypothetical protein AVEN_107396-1 [Araneus ventricosus]|uniref:Uncharacterized protein n=1 Tax=Araneus ventricosus TaxID=182803 RepID=A0A4Y2X2M3_ARAVE|nr:hypothetical protein AVEN_107396-1 [Araneus ventricosus]